ncbi:MAG TPA: zinc-ribbon domain-containing protein [Gaiellaceae bacterium]|nr:zinc-ribbon domain-containing protein [Gaiellaceae bacterium]
MSAAECANCGSPLPARSRFCPECGTRVDAADGDTQIQDVPPHEARPAPVDVMWSERRFFGVAPSTALFGLGIGALVLGIVLLVAGHPLWALILFAAAVLTLVAFVSQTRRLPDQASGVARASVHALDAVKARAGATIETVAAHGNAQIEQMRLRREIGQLNEEREHELVALGAAAYADDEDAVALLKQRIGELDAERERKKQQIAEISEATAERVKEAQLQAQATRVVPPSEGADTPENEHRPEN